jgi:phage terminase large subunit-like protein
VRALFGSRDPATNVRHIKEIFALVGKGNSKTTYSAGLMVVALLMNVRRNVEFLFVAPTQAISDLAYDAAKAMIEADEELLKRFLPRAHKKDIYDRVMKSKLKVKTFGLNVMTGPKPAGVLVDELHLLGRYPYTAKVLRQIRGGMEKSTDGFVIFTTTQSDDVPMGAFSDELKVARLIRDGKLKGRMLPVLYEFPEDIANDQAKWEDTKLWPMVIPNLGRSLQLHSLIEDYRTEKAKGAAAIKLWASQHLNIQIGLGLKNDGWVGAPYYEKQMNPFLTLEKLIERSEVIVVGVDGGGLDDLFALKVIGRDKITKHWMAVSRCWVDRGLLALRPSIASALEGFAARGELEIVDDAMADLEGIVAVIEQVKESGKLHCVAVDPAGLGELVEELKGIGVTAENKDLNQLIGVSQGYALMNAIKTAERKLKNGTLWVDTSTLAAWCVSNLKIEPTATAIRATKQNAGDAKIDDVMALFDGVAMMVKDPAPPAGRSYMETASIMVLG